MLNHCLFVGTFLNGFYFFLFDFRLPFDEKTLLYYAIAYLIECAALFSILVGAAAAVCHLIGSCWLIVAFVEDISIELPTLSIDDEESSPNEREWTERLINIIQLHSHIKQLSKSQIEIPLNKKRHIFYSLLDFEERSMKFMNLKLCSSTCIRIRPFVPPFSYYSHNQLSRN